MTIECFSDALNLFGLQILNYAVPTYIALTMQSFVCCVVTKIQKSNNSKISQKYWKPGLLATDNR